MSFNQIDGDCTTATAARREHEAQCCHDLRIDGIVDDVSLAWLRGDFAHRLDTFRDAKGKPDTLLSMMSETLCDSPGNPLRDVLDIVRLVAREQSALGVRAGTLIERMAFEHASGYCERVAS